MYTKSIVSRSIMNRHLRGRNAKYWLYNASQTEEKKWCFCCIKAALKYSIIIDYNSGRTEITLIFGQHYIYHLSAWIIADAENCNGWNERYPASLALGGHIYWAELSPPFFSIQIRKHRCIYVASFSLALISIDCYE